MKKLFLGALLLVFAGVMAACGSNNGAESGKKEIVVAATKTPHAEILKEAEPLLKEKGYTLKVKVLSDYKMYNKALADKEVDANYFQHIPYLEQEMKENTDYKLVNAGAVHLEPFGIYSKTYKSLKDLPDGATIILTNNVAEQGRMLAMLENAGLITLDPKVETVDATLKDIKKNPKNLEFKKVAPELTAKAYENKEGDAVFINVNYAIQNKLNPKKDAIEVESTKNNPYANIIAVRKGEEDSAKIKALMEVLHSKKIKDFIEKKYDGAVLPVSE
ncbi:methionine ABC transporter substrate-binding lipoprotein MetQ [Bacillus subtilis]|uniref:Methionine ABC transporter substrate-binding lipoprotein MetQ n=2 Tax=Bacillus subtilis TaxID=1423 RepID=A0AC61YZ32_BACIU|nr:methionine ABC transporter substrate-binding lipoprotein MetQ [Bacillus subtilis]KIU05520.1 methionine ABC transporter, substrate binding lipoprotein [Bacillus subtilis]MEC0314812.1 methionine ABC transporter substrate-binding lipoprotein MetQ [Bacillus subtilis]MEC0363738.1 methionine ABC transporter substrate-binding lipoprotein MetQ [Bacillus subtilis]MED3601052.1 methionine ABC transporter substrate-binding lipoprotein MetQ [Bacillus subtilis]MED3695453.1 methionine ABC transporter subs